MPLAWQVDPCLGLSLLDHYPAVAEVRAGLQRLVLQHATSPEVQALPKAALLLAAMPSNSTARQAALAYLPIWTPGSGELQVFLCWFATRQSFGRGQGCTLLGRCTHAHIATSSSCCWGADAAD